MGVVNEITVVTGENALVKRSLINLSIYLTDDFKKPCKELDAYLEEMLDHDDFQKVYDIIQSLETISPIVYGKIYSYFYYHYC